MNKFIYTVISILIIIPVLIIRSKIYEWVYNDVIRIIPEFIWKPIDLIFAIVVYTIIAVAIYQIIDDLRRNEESKQNEFISQKDRESEGMKQINNTNLMSSAELEEFVKEEGLKQRVEHLYNERAGKGPTNFSIRGEVIEKVLNEEKTHSSKPEMYELAIKAAQQMKKMFDRNFE